MLKGISQTPPDYPDSSFRSWRLLHHRRFAKVFPSTVVSELPLRVVSLAANITVQGEHVDTLSRLARPRPRASTMNSSVMSVRVVLLQISHQNGTNLTPIYLLFGFFLDRRSFTTFRVRTILLLLLSMEVSVVHVQQLWRVVGLGTFRTTQSNVGVSGFKVSQIIFPGKLFVAQGTHFELKKK